MRVRIPTRRIASALTAVVDFAVAMASPKRGIERAGLRKVATSLQAGSSDGRLVDWNAPNGDANAVTIPDLLKVRDRSRDAALNNPIAQAVRRTMADYVVDRGLRPQSQVDAKLLGISEQQAQDWQGACDSFYETECKKADVTGKCDMPALQRLIYLSMWDGGDVFPSFPMVADDEGRKATRINLIEAERVDSPPDLISDPYVNGGVATDKWGKPYGFHVYRGHPGDVKSVRAGNQFEFWARVRGGRLNVMQLYHQDRIGQARGIPGFAQGLPLIDQIGEYVDDVALQAQIQTRMGFFLEVAGDPITQAKAMGTTKFYETLQKRGIAPAAFNLIRQGDKVHTVGPTAPGQYFDQFLVRLQRVIAACIGAPYEILFGDVAAANFSSIRAGFLSFRKKIQGEQDILIPVLQAYWNHVIHEAWIDGLLGDVGKTIPFEQNPAAWTRANWIRPAPGYVDPTKEFGAYKIAVDNGFMSLGQVIAEGGGKFEDVADKIAYEQRYLRQKGVDLLAWKQGQQQPQQGDPNAPQQDPQAPADEQQAPDQQPAPDQKDPGDQPPTDGND